MRVPINLARDPFRRDRAMYVASAAAALALSVVLVFLISMAVGERQQTEETRIAIDSVSRQITGIRREQAQLDLQIRKPGNEVVLDRSLLINELIQRKAISWTRIFADLDKVLPPNVRIMAISPKVNQRDQLFLDMTVAAESPEPIIGFIAQLEGSDVFGSTAVSTISPPTQTDNSYRYRLSVNYAQKL